MYALSTIPSSQFNTSPTKVRFGELTESQRGEAYCVAMSATPEELLDQLSEETDKTTRAILQEALRIKRNNKN